MAELTNAEKAERAAANTTPTVGGDSTPPDVRPGDEGQSKVPEGRMKVAESGINATDHQRTAAEQQQQTWGARDLSSRSSDATASERSRRPTQIQSDEPWRLSGGGLTAHRPSGNVDELQEGLFLDQQRNELKRALKLAEEGEYDLISVKSIRSDDRVAAFDRDDAHPNGFALVGNRTSPPTIVARTQAIEAALARRDIAIVGVVDRVPD